jgi:DNA repair protein RadC
MKTDTALLKTLVGGGIYPGQPATSVLVPRVAYGPRLHRTKAQAVKLKALGRLIRRMRSRRNPSFEGTPDAELIRLLTGASVTADQASRLLIESPNTSARELEVEYGLTSKQAEKLSALGQLYLRLLKAKIQPGADLRTPEQVYDLFGPLIVKEPVEQMWILPLNSRSRLMADPQIVSVGDVHGTECSPHIVLRKAMRLGAVSIIIVHNHPTGDASASAADRTVTIAVYKAGQLLQITLLDHIVVAANGYTSIRRESPGMFS